MRHLSWLQLAISTGCSKCCSSRRLSPCRWPCHSSSLRCGCLHAQVIRSRKVARHGSVALVLSGCHASSSTHFLAPGSVCPTDTPFTEAVQVATQPCKLVKATNVDASGLLELRLAEHSVPRPAPRKPTMTSKS